MVWFVCMQMEALRTAESHAVTAATLRDRVAELEAQGHMLQVFIYIVAITFEYKK